MHFFFWIEVLLLLIIFLVGCAAAAGAAGACAAYKISTEAERGTGHCFFLLRFGALHCDAWDVCWCCCSWLLPILSFRLRQSDYGCWLRCCWDGMHAGNKVKVASKYLFFFFWSMWCCIACCCCCLQHQYWSGKKYTLPFLSSLSPLLLLLFPSRLFYCCCCWWEGICIFIRAKRVSNWYIPKKKSARVSCARVHACSTSLGFSIRSANRIWPKHGIPLPV